jgi:hypothetical protein
MGGGSNSAERAAQEVSLAVDFGARLNFTSLNRPVVRWPASALVHITDSSRTSLHVRNVPGRDSCTAANLTPSAGEMGGANYKMKLEVNSARRLLSRENARPR